MTLTPFGEESSNRRALVQNSRKISSRYFKPIAFLIAIKKTFCKNYFDTTNIQYFAHFDFMFKVTSGFFDIFCYIFQVFFKVFK